MTGAEESDATGHAADASEHRALLSCSVADFVERGTDIARVRRLRDTPGEYDRGVWRKMAGLGWLGILVPEAYGGLGLGLTEMAIVAEGLARALTPEPLTAAAVLAGIAIAEGDREAVKRDLLRSLVAGDVLPALAWQEEAGTLDVTAIKTRAAPFEGGLRLNGRKRFIAGAAGADGFAVSAQTADGVGLFWVARTAPGVELGFEPLADGRRFGMLALSDVFVPGDRVIAGAATARAVIEKALDHAAVIAAAELYGVMSRALEMSLDYMKTRVQFGKPIGSFQALQHRAVDLYIQQQLASAVLQEALSTHRASGSRARRSRFTAPVVTPTSTTSGFISSAPRCSRHGSAMQRCIAGAMRTSWCGRTVKDEGMADWNAMTDEAFRGELRAFFERNYPPHLRYLPRRARWDEIKDWWRQLYEKGWIAPNWPREWGGMGLDAAKMVLYLEEMERWGIARPPDQGITQVGPIIMAFGTEAQQRDYLPRTLSGEYIWCQGYSEPNAGSDLASLVTSAVIDGDSFVVNGQKIWTTLAHDATHIYTLVRTDKQAKKQAGISFLLIDLKTPGITIRPIRNLAGHDEFCEVFFDNVRVPRTTLVGDLNAGWTVAKALLSFERLNIGSPRRPQYALRRLEMMARAKGLFHDPGFVDQFTRIKLDLEDLASLYGRYVAAVKRGEPLGEDVSILKISTMETWQRLTEFLMETAQECGCMAGELDFDGVGVDVLAPFYYSRPATIYGGSSEIQRNILAKYVLKLPS
jgi:alkylation response protein AidB-like acyl-CoA dehydrogenase